MPSGRLIAAAIEAARATIGDRPVRLTATVADDIPEWQLGDGARLAQVIDNLLSNAVKFTAVGEVRLRAFVAYGGRAVPMLRVDVTDTGIGIEADRMAQIFQPFELGDASMTRRYGGTGLGLAISTRLADLMGGWVRGASVPGEGATFSLEVPLRSAPPPEVRGPEPHACRRRARSLQVLVADDDPVNRQIAQRLLERLGHRVRTVVGRRRRRRGVAPRARRRDPDGPRDAGPRRLRGDARDPPRAGRAAPALDHRGERARRRRAARLVARRRAWTTTSRSRCSGSASRRRSGKIPA